METKRIFPSDLTDEQWAVLSPMLPNAKPGGRPRKYDIRDVMNALLYQARTGCQWRYLPPTFPPWQTVYTYFRNWKQDGTWERVNRELVQQARVRKGRNAEPSAGILDSQSVKTTRQGRRSVSTVASG
jgi:putative transposase